MPGDLGQRQVGVFLQQRENFLVDAIHDLPRHFQCPDSRILRALYRRQWEARSGGDPFRLGLGPESKLANLEAMGLAHGRLGALENIVLKIGVIGELCGRAIEVTGTFAQAIPAVRNAIQSDALRCDALFRMSEVPVTSARNRHDGLQRPYGPRSDVMPLKAIERHDVATATSFTERKDIAGVVLHAVWYS